MVVRASTLSLQLALPARRQRQSVHRLAVQPTAVSIALATSKCQGWRGNDTLTGDGERQQLGGGAGADTIDGALASTTAAVFGIRQAGVRSAWWRRGQYRRMTQGDVLTNIETEGSPT